MRLLNRTVSVSCLVDWRARKTAFEFGVCQFATINCQHSTRTRKWFTRNKTGDRLISERAFFAWQFFCATIDPCDRPLSIFGETRCRGNVAMLWCVDTSAAIQSSYFSCFRILFIDSAFEANERNRFINKSNIDVEVFHSRSLPMQSISFILCLKPDYINYFFTVFVVPNCVPHCQMYSTERCILQFEIISTKLRAHIRIHWTIEQMLVAQVLCGFIFRRIFLETAQQYSTGRLVKMTDWVHATKIKTLRPR